MSTPKVVILFLMLCQTLTAQVEEILCKVIEEGTRYPVAYATIQFENSGNGVIANIEGDFRIPYQYKLDKDTIVISCIGYETKRVELQTLEDRNINVIILKPKIEELEQVVISGKKVQKWESGYTLVKKAIANIPNNYPNQSFSSVGYYRDYQIINDDYYNLNEAIVESFDAGFDTDIMMDSYNQNALYKYSENKEFSRDSSLVKAYDGESKYIENTTLSGQGGNELGILNIHDPIRNFEQLSFSFVYVFKKRFLTNHEFETMKRVYLDDEPIYEIRFDALERLTGVSHKASGKIYISERNYAIHKLEYQVYETKNVDDPLFEVKIEYAPKNDKMYLNYITFNNRFVVSSSFSFDITKIDYDANEKAFYIKFNNDVQPSSVQKRDFRFKYQKKKLVVKDFEIIDEKNIKVNIAEWSIPDTIDEATNMSAFEYRIKNIYDVADRKLFKSPEITGYQFREFFIQEIFESKLKPMSLEYMQKSKPLSEAPVNQNRNKETYWLNTPLKTVNN